MPVRLRITLLFTALVFMILSLVCISIYYFSNTSRKENIEKRLTNRALTTGRLLSQSEVFTKDLVQRIDSSTTIALKNKVVHAYDHNNRLIYRYQEREQDSITVDEKMLDDARVSGSYYFRVGKKDAVALHYTDNTSRMVLIAAAEDVDGVATLDMLYNILLFSFIGGIIATFIVGYIFSRQLLKPIRKIAYDVSEISARNLSNRIGTGATKDEWHYLSATLNELLNRLQDSFESQKRFLANASHELSTPLTSISSQLEIGLQRTRSAEEYREIIQSVYQDVQLMNRLTQTLLEFAKASANSGGLELGPVRMDEVVLLMPGEMSKVNREYKVEIDFAGAPENEEELVVYGNEPLLFLAIRNIVINACKYSSDGKATISLTFSKPRIVITICDQGPGITESDIPKIFHPFYRADNAEGHKGFGLGLSLSERIIKLHNGSIHVSSALGKGSCFSVHLSAAGASVK